MSLYYAEYNIREKTNINGLSLKIRTGHEKLDKLPEFSYKYDNIKE